MRVDGIVRTVWWGDAGHADCTGKIVSVEPMFKGKVKLDNDLEFENPAECNNINNNTQYFCKTATKYLMQHTPMQKIQCNTTPPQQHMHAHIQARRLLLLYQVS